MLAAAAVGIGLGLTTNSSPPGPATPRSRAQADAARLTLQRSDLPSGWSIDSSPDGPLSGFLTSPDNAQPPTPAERQQAAQAAQRYESCLGIPASQDSILGAAGPAPLAQVSSPAFRSPDQPRLEAGSQTEVFADAGPVAQARAQIAQPKFSDCFGSAVGQELVAGGQQAQGTSGSSPIFGTPATVPVDLPRHSGITGAGVDITLPFSVGGQSGALQFGVVLMGGGRAESTLLTFGGSAGFPTRLTGRLAGALEQKLAANR